LNTSLITIAKKKVCPTSLRKLSGNMWRIIKKNGLVEEDLEILIFILLHPKNHLNKNNMSKAQELVDKYKGLVYPYLGSGMLVNQTDDDIVLKNAQICARISIQEVITALSMCYSDENVISYWKESLKNIDKTV